MSEKQLRFITPSWSEIEELCMEIAEDVLRDGYKPDIVVGVLRGGIIPAKIVADYIGVKRIATVEVKFYAGIGATREEPVITQPLIENVRGQRILLVDDVADTGKTLAHVASFLNYYGPSEVRTATVYVKPWSMVKPDYYGEETDAWIIFPWERLEMLTELVEHHGFSLEDASEVTGIDPERAEQLLRLHRSS
ncbi:phosphoribosyltransferase [Pyrolobus fumarii 1A]|uniref:Phosphoribosyltransferase n=1 Tax=Pyrolobus fumarii (strain DSM 11204 / 1A) TaxID=694429 RepID=G0ECP5_PYRF1|nr:phosphoribosyltransferase [Pyrolobus fumarii]AEM39615.1 phosphoribosyltransferase [Pyrolobus fumarii 1A]